MEDENHLLVLRFEKDAQSVLGAEECMVPPSKTNRLACLKTVLCSFIAEEILGDSDWKFCNHPNNLENPDPSGAH